VIKKQLHTTSLAEAFARFCVAALSLSVTVSAQQKKNQESYPVHTDSKQVEGVPEGKLIHGQFSESKVFPGTVRDYWVYVPQQYEAEKEVGVMVFQDGRNYAKRDAGFRALNVFDNLMHSGEMPVTIGVFIQPGVVPAPNENAQPRFNRSFEYDSMDDRYSQFLIEEMLPHIEAKHGVKFSDDPNCNAICGSSSGGIAAFNVAWHRPDVFRRVFTTVGTYVSLRGGDTIAGLVRKTEPKPLRIFLQDGENDLNIYGGDWWIANQQLLRALQWSGYEVKHEFGKGGHSGKHGAAIFPDVMRWLWEKPKVETHSENSKHEAHTKFLVDGEGWELVGEGYGWAEGLAVTGDGTLYFTDVHNAKLYRVKPGGKPEIVVEDTGRANGISLGADGRLYGACGGARQIRSWDLETFEMEVIADGTSCNDIVVHHNGTIYYTDPKETKVWKIDGKTRKRVVVDRFKNCNGIGLSADQTQLFVAHFPGRFVYSFSIKDDGSLANKQPYFHMEIPVNRTEGQLDGMCVTADGFLVASSSLGVQICDQPGRSHLIIPMPPGSPRSCYVAFGGADGKTLYVANVDKVYKRKTKMTGAPSWKGPVNPAKPRL